MAISAQLVKELRDKTGAGMMDCKKALSESDGDLEKAVDVLRKQGLKNVSKRVGKIASEGTVFSYLHTGGRIGVLLELNCETDFVARGEDFQGLASDIAMHIAWANPSYVDQDSVPEDAIRREENIHRSQLNEKQQEMADKIIPGKMKKFFEETCLLNQYDAKDAAAKKTIGSLVNDLSVKIGEKVTLRRFVRYEVGEGIEKEVVDYAKEVAEAANV